MAYDLTDSGSGRVADYGKWQPIAFTEPVGMKMLLERLYKWGLGVDISFDNEQQTYLVETYPDQACAADLGRAILEVFCEREGFPVEGA